jgi:hypothetical protein
MRTPATFSQKTIPIARPANDSPESHAFFPSRGTTCESVGPLKAPPVRSERNLLNCRTPARLRPCPRDPCVAPSARPGPTFSRPQNANPAAAMCRCGVFGVFVRLGLRSQAFARAPHRLLRRRSRSPTGSTSRASRDASAFGLTSILACGAMGATDKLRANKMIAGCDHNRRDFVNARHPCQFAKRLARCRKSRGVPYLWNDSGRAATPLAASVIHQTGPLDFVKLALL